jgi:hypothetical protein
MWSETGGNAFSTCVCTSWVDGEKLLEGFGKTQPGGENETKP